MLSCQSSSPKTSSNMSLLSRASGLPSSFHVEQVRELHSAIRWNREKDVKRMLKSLSIGPDIARAADPGNGNTALHVAAQNGQVKIVEMLLELGVSPDAQNNAGNTPVHMSVTYNHDEVTQLLDRAGAA